MTRGTIHCINKNNTISYSTQFNGDMYLDGRGYKVISALMQLKDETEFEGMVSEFNSENFEYTGKLLYEVIFKGDGIKCECGEAISDPTYADYTYWVNFSGKPIRFIDREGKKLIVERGGVAVFNFCHRYLKVYSEE